MTKRPLPLLAPCRYLDLESHSPFFQLLFCKLFILHVWVFWPGLCNTGVPGTLRGKKTTLHPLRLVTATMWGLGVKLRSGRASSVLITDPSLLPLSYSFVLFFYSVVIIVEFVYPKLFKLNS